MDRTKKKLTLSAWF